MRETYGHTVKGVLLMIIGSTFLFAFVLLLYRQIKIAGKVLPARSFVVNIK